MATSQRVATALQWDEKYKPRKQGHSGLSYLSTIATTTIVTAAIATATIATATISTTTTATPSAPPVPHLHSHVISEIYTWIETVKHIYCYSFQYNTSNLFTECIQRLISKIYCTSKHVGQIVCYQSFYGILTLKSKL